MAIVVATIRAEANHNPAVARRSRLDCFCTALASALPALSTRDLAASRHTNPRLEKHDTDAGTELHGVEASRDLLCDHRPRGPILGMRLADVLVQPLVNLERAEPVPSGAIGP